MAGTSTALADASFLQALLDRRDRYNAWAIETAARFPPPWHTCEAALSETFFILGRNGAPTLIALLQNHAVTVSFDLRKEQASVLILMEKYADVPISLADACLVRMTEIHPEPMVLTTDTDFNIYRRHSRQVVPCALPD